MKVFQMNEFDWVAAMSMAEAIDWYERTTGLDWTEDIDDINPVECDLDKERKVFLHENIHEPTMTTFRKILKMDEEERPITEPYVILSTEY